MWGVDNTFLSRVVDGDVFEPYEAAGLDDVPAALRDARARRRGDAGRLRRRVRQLRHRPGSPSTTSTRRPTSRRSPTRRTRDLLVVENPATSSPGLAFLLATIAEFGDDGWADYWTRPRAPTASRSSTAGPRPTTSASAAPATATGRSSSATARARRPRCCSPTRRSTRRPRRSSTRRASARSSSPACCAAPTHADEARRLVDFLLSPSVPGRAAAEPVRVPGERRTSPCPRRSPTYAVVPDRPGDARPGDDRRQPRRRGSTTWTEIVAAADAPAGRPPRSNAASADRTAGLVDRRSWPPLAGAGRRPRRVLRLAVRHAARPRAEPVGDRRHARSAPSTWRGRCGSRCGRPCVSTVLTVVVGLAPAYVLARYRFPGRRLLDGLLAAVFVLPTVVMGAAVLAAAPDVARARRRRRSSSPTSCSTSPSSCAPSAPCWRRICRPTSRPRRRRSARRRGGRSARSPCRCCAPAIAAAAGIVFVFTFTSFGVVRILGGAATRRSRWRSGAGRRSSATSAPRRRSPCCSSSPSAPCVVLGRRDSSAGTAVRARPAAGAPRHGPRAAAASAASSPLVATATAVVVATPLLALVERSLRAGDGYSLAGVAHLGRTEVRPGITHRRRPARSRCVTSLRGDGRRHRCWPSSSGRWPRSPSPPPAGTAGCSTPA